MMKLSRLLLSFLNTVVLGIFFGANLAFNLVANGVSLGNLSFAPLVPSFLLLFFTFAVLSFMYARGYNDAVIEKLREKLKN